MTWQHSELSGEFTVLLRTCLQVLGSAFVATPTSSNYGDVWTFTCRTRNPGWYLAAFCMAGMCFCFLANRDNLALISLGMTVVLVFSKLRVQVGKEDFCHVFQVLAVLSQFKCFWCNTKTSGNLEKTKLQLAVMEDLLWLCTGFQRLTFSA